LYNFGYRDYAPEAARFTTVDPIRDGSNWFAYVNNDPVNWVDLWGLQCISASDKTAAGKPSILSGLGLIVGGIALGVATIVEDFVLVTGGVLNDPITLSAAGALIATGLGQIAATKTIEIINSTTSSPTVTEVRGSKPERAMRPDDAPTGTKPIDQSGLGHDAIEDIKRSAGQGSNHWTGISLDEDVIVNDGTGHAENLGHWTSLTDYR
jgi:uncharacterized protein RhaS with RHS repeats